MIDKKINVLVVDDSAVDRMHLVHMLEADPQINVIATVNDGHAALDFLKENQPDVVVMDVHLPGLDGFETTQHIMQTRPLPIVICSATTDPRAVATTFRMMEVGAVACVAKPPGRRHPDFEPIATDFRQTIKLMSEIRVVRRWAKKGTIPVHASAVPTENLSPPSQGIRFIGIGTSTGGPPALHTILATLPKNFPAPILIVQHITPNFLIGMVDWLNKVTGLQICIATHGSYPLPGHVYLAPDDFHMGIAPDGSIHLSKTAPESGMRPAVSYLFRSLAQAHGPASVGVLLTGMGRDGALELKQMRDQGAITIAQDRASSVVHGMPGTAIALGGAMHVSPVDEISAMLIALCKSRNGQADSPLKMAAPS